MNPSNQSALPLPQTNDITYAGSIDLLYGLQGWYLDFNYNDLVYSQQKTENDILDLLNEQHDIYNMVLVLKLHDPANCMNSIPTNINKFKNLLMLQVGSSRMWDMHLKDLPASLERLDLLDTSTNSSNQAELLEQAKQLTKIKHVRFYCSDAYMCFSDPELKEHMEYNRENCGVFPDIKTIEIIELELGDCRYTFDADWKEKAMNHPYLSLIKYRIQSLEEIKIGIKIKEFLDVHWQPLLTKLRIKHQDLITSQFDEWITDLRFIEAPTDLDVNFFQDRSIHSKKARRW